MERRGPPSSSNPPSVLRSSVSMFIEDSRITAVANAEPPFPRQPPMVAARRPSYFSVTSYTSTSSTSGGFRQSPGGREPPRPRACSSSPVRFPGREFMHSIIREEEVVSSSSGARPPPPPPSTVRRRSTLSVDPVNYPSRDHLPPLREDRAYTSVNLTLRAPGGSSSGGTSGEMNVRVHHHEVEGACGGVGISGPPGHLMYSSCSTSRDGFEAQVQIHFGPSGGTFMASRRRTTAGREPSGSSGREGSEVHRQEQFSLRTTTRHNISIRQQMSTDLLSAQTERKDKLRTAIQDRRRLLATLQTEIGHLRSQLEQNGAPVSELDKLKKENQRLRIECQFMSREVDLFENGSVPLGETSEEFYEGINTGQSIHALFGITNNRRKIGGRPPPRPPPPKFFSHEEPPKAEERMEQGEWKCSMCTFQNHRDLDFCEQCNMVRVKQPQQQPVSSSSSQQYFPN